VLEYRAGSSALPGIAARVATTLSRQTSLAVLGQDQTRAIYGEPPRPGGGQVRGDAACVARIGQKVGAAEIILVGVGELGDVILTMQRIDVANREVTGRIADSLAAASAPTDAEISAYVTRLMPPSDFVRFGVIDIVANLAGAAVTVGGQSRARRRSRRSSCRHRRDYDIRVDLPGYVPFTTRVALPPDGEVKVEAELSGAAPPAACTSTGTCSPPPGSSSPVGRHHGLPRDPEQRRGDGRRHAPRHGVHSVSITSASSALSW